MEYIFQKINDVKIISKPFPHIIIEDFFDEEFINELINSIKIDNINEIKSKYHEVIYPGAIDKKLSLTTRPTGSGLVYALNKSILDKHEIFVNLLESDGFKQVLFDKFNIPKEIDGWNVYQINKDLNGYEISPHPDVTGKIITWQCNITNDNTLDNYNLSTRLHTIKPEYKDELNKITSDKNPRPWGKWEWFDEGISVPYKENAFFAFAPSNISHHSVILDNYPQDRSQRTMMRGFIVDNRLLEKKPKEFWQPGNIVNII